MFSTQVKTYLEEVIHNMPSDWLTLTTHRLDIYNEELAKTQFLDQFEGLYRENNASTQALSALPTAYDYIRLGHPLSCVLEWAIAKSISQPSENVISFSSKTTPILAILRKNLLENRNTQILHTGDLPDFFDTELVRDIYGYTFELQQVGQGSEIPTFEGSTIFISQQEQFGVNELSTGVDFFINLHANLGTVLLANGEKNSAYISEIQHVRRRETIAMTPENCLLALKSLIGQEAPPTPGNAAEANKASVLASIQAITGTTTIPLAASSGLSMQYAIMMGLVHDAAENHPGKAIKFIVPPNCYGGTNDQSRRVAACIDQVEVVDLPVDGDNDMVQSLETILTRLAGEDAVPYIIAEIPTNPRVEVPNLEQLKAVLSKERKTPTGEKAIASVFILDQTFCPNYLFLGEGEILSTVKAISYASGSKFPSGGKCTAGYCVANNLAAALMDKIALHLQLCDNEATSLQYEILAKQLPSMNQRIKDAYVNTRDFVNYIQQTLPTAKINFVSKELADQGFTPSVFSLDLPTKGNSPEEKEAYKRALNLKLINMMITEIPDESKYCVSYGQLKGCYWTIPATSTQGTTKEGDKDYIIRASLSPNMDLKRHKEVFQNFVDEI
ncbi:PLP-dependent aminotransferase family protein [Algoriphagus yeomjeoni]|uniref:Cys/Met metabolism PLP-dependent enzyme n=1 Tax=Algoriphagus yeomjeoni TaxID=291403 RepID=A0A327NUW4_9BACT|nr:PLP-dependent transferase [Algoriphagus yeomjeoni]RAI83845.1 Cys/Met metabolism PLP-dependent enzyme [Algoriphagus yeomjeoni]